MNLIAYDFDGTIYDGDSSVDFYIYCLIRRPYIFILWPIQIVYAFLYVIGLIDKTKMKESFFSYLRIIKKKEVLLENFWIKNMKKIKGWYIKKNHKQDIIISASPEFLLEIPCKKFKIKDLIASEVDVNTGKFLSKNCHGTQKVYRIKSKYPKAKVKEMYTDSKVDKPMIDYAEKGFLVKKNDIFDFYEYMNKKGW